MATFAEQETTVTQGAREGLTYVYSSVPKHVRRMEGDARFERREGDGATWGNYVIASDSFDPLKGVKRKRAPMSEAQRLAAGERLRAAREGRDKLGDPSYEGGM